MKFISFILINLIVFSSQVANMAIMLNGARKLSPSNAINIRLPVVQLVRRLGSSTEMVSQQPPFLGIEIIALL